MDRAGLAVVLLLGAGAFAAVTVTAGSGVWPFVPGETDEAVVEQ